MREPDFWAEESVAYLALIVAFSLFQARLAAGWAMPPEEGIAARVTMLALAWTTLFLAVPLACGLVFGTVALQIVLLIHVTLLAGGVSLVWFVQRPRRIGWSMLLGPSIGRRWWSVIRRSPWGAKLLWVAVALWVAGTLVPGWFLPPRAYDALDYHFAQQAALYRGEGFSLRLPVGDVIEPIMARGFSTPNIKMFFGVQLAAARGGLEGAGLVQGLFLVLWILVLWALGERFGLPSWCSAVGALFLASVPEIMLQATALYSDVQAAAAIGFVIWALLGLSHGERPWRWVLTCALAFGHLAAAKHSVLPVAALLGVLALAVSTWRTRDWKLPATVFGASILAGIMMAGPWIVMTWSEYGNPIYPAGLELGGARLLEGVYTSDVTANVLANGTGLTANAAWWHNALEAGGVTLLSGWTSGLGPQWWTVGVPALLLCASRTRQSEKHGLWMVFFGSAIAVLAGMPHLWYARFMLAMGTLLAVAVAAAMQRVEPWTRGILLVLLAVCMAWNLFRVIPACQYRPRAPMVAAYPFLTGDSAPVYLNEFPGEYSSRDYVRESLAERGLFVGIAVPGVVAGRLVGTGDGLALRAVPVPRAKEFESAASWRDTLGNEGITHLLVRQDSPAESYLREIRAEQVWRDSSWHAEHPWGPEARPPESIWKLPSDWEVSP